MPVEKTKTENKDPHPAIQRALWLKRANFITQLLKENFTYEQIAWLFKTTRQAIWKIHNERSEENKNNNK